MQAIAAEENNGRPFPAYEKLLEAVNAALGDELEADEQVIFSTRYGKDIVALKTAEGTVIPFATLSDGYRNVIKIVLDIATRMCILNPYLQGKALEETPGVVVIDEVDLSLHPNWQKKIIGILKKLFPKIQFICAMHSPFIIQSLEEGELILLDSDEQPDGDQYAGESIEDIAEEIMGVDMPQYSDKKIKMLQAATDFYEALASSRSDAEIENLRKQMTILEAEYGDALPYLENRIGSYCSYCEFPLNHVPEVEHVVSKKKNPELRTAWSYLLLGCKYCNTRKKDIVDTTNVENYLWPDVYNTAAAFKFETALAMGFFSVWMTVFADEPEMLKRFIAAYPGTESLYYDENGTVKPLLILETTTAD